jgi:putative oxidoreductase
MFAESKTLLRLGRLQPLALLVLRLVLGTIMIAHGYAKVFGSFLGIEQMVSDLGFPSWLAYPLAGTELGGGILMIAGVFTRFVSFAMLIDMRVAIWKIHWPNGLRGNGGYEFPLALAAIAFALIFLGAGPMALDRFLGCGPAPNSSRIPNASSNYYTGVDSDRSRGGV